MSETLHCRHVADGQPWTAYVIIEGPAYDVKGGSHAITARLCPLCRHALTQALRVEPINARARKDPERE